MSPESTAVSQARLAVHLAREAAARRPSDLGDVRLETALSLLEDAEAREIAAQLQAVAA